MNEKRKKIQLKFFSFLDQKLPFFSLLFLSVFLPSLIRIRIANPDPGMDPGTH
jgi:hypothetical protein